jgi:intracellular sulfur oxidation DsrE/DsrF family protein
VFDVSRPDFEPPLDLDYKVVFDVAAGSSDASRVSPDIATVARFLNMHARAGVRPERIHAALVLHGGAAKYALVDAAYRKRFGNDNPNLDLLEQLRGAGVRIVLCGQTAVSSGFEREEIAAPVEVALSAMTALVTLQRDGYALIP